MKTKNIFLNSDTDESNTYCENLHHALTCNLSYDTIIAAITDTVHGDGIQLLIDDIQDIAHNNSDDNATVRIRQKIYETVQDKDIIEKILYRTYETQDIYQIMLQVEQDLDVPDGKYSFVRDTRYNALTKSDIFKLFVADIVAALDKPSQNEKHIYIRAAQKGLTANLLNVQVPQD